MKPVSSLPDPSNRRCKILPEGLGERVSRFRPDYIAGVYRFILKNCFVGVIEGKIKGQIEVTRRRGRRRKELLDELKDMRGYCQLKEEALDRTVWRNRFGRGFGPVV